MLSQKARLLASHSISLRKQQKRVRSLVPREEITCSTADKQPQQPDPACPKSPPESASICCQDDAACQTDEQINPADYAEVIRRAVQSAIEHNEMCWIDRKNEMGKSIKADYDKKT